MGNAAGDYISGLCDISKVPHNPGDQQGQSKFDQRDANTGQEVDSFERNSIQKVVGLYLAKYLLKCTLTLILKQNVFIVCMYPEFK